MFIQAAQAALNFIYPFFCGGCGVYLKKGYLCDLCSEKLRIINYKCPKCSYPYEQNIGRACPDCLKTKKYFIGNISAYSLNKETLELIHKFKYKRDYGFGRFMAERIARLGENEDFKYITCPPSSGEFKHMEFIAEITAELMNLKFVRCLIKDKKVLSQTKLKRKERLENVKGAFKCRKIKGIEKILLIDDIYTTGATLNECAKVLKKAGLKKIVCRTFAYNKKLVKSL